MCSIHRGLRQCCPLSPYLFIVVLSSLMLDVKTFFEGLYLHVPWTFSAQHPLTDLEYADDTVLMARTQATLHRLGHLLQHLAAQRGLSLNPHKCKLLLLNTTLPISLSKTVTATDPCLCKSCAPFLDPPILTPHPLSHKWTQLNI